MKRLLSTLLAVLLLCGLLPVGLSLPAQAGGRTLYVVDENYKVHEVNEDEPEGPGWSCDMEILTLKDFKGKAVFGFCCGLVLEGSNELNGVYINGFYGNNPTYVSGRGELTVAFDKAELDCAKYDWGQYPGSGWAIPEQYHDHAFTFDCQYGEGSPECHLSLGSMEATGGVSSGDSAPLHIADKSKANMVIELLETEDGKAASFVHIGPKGGVQPTTPPVTKPALLNSVQFVYTQEDQKDLISRVCRMNEVDRLDLSGLGSQDDELNAPYIVYSGLQKDKTYGLVIEMASEEEPIERLLKQAGGDLTCGLYYLLPAKVNSYKVELCEYDSFPEDGGEPTGRKSAGSSVEFSVISGRLDMTGVDPVELPQWVTDENGERWVYSLNHFGGAFTNLPKFTVGGAEVEMEYYPLYSKDAVDENGRRPYYYDLQYIIAPAGGSKPTPAPQRFEDVKPTDWFYNEVEYVAEKGLMQGRGQNTFMPKVNTTRAELVVVLYRMAGEPEVSGGISFPDAKADWYKNAVAWAVENEIVNGYAGGSFKPNRDISREEFAAILVRYAKYRGLDSAQSGSGGNVLDGFADKDSVSSFARDAMSWAVSQEIIGGVVKDNVSYIDPQGKTSRAQTAVMLQRFCENVQGRL